MRAPPSEATLSADVQSALAMFFYTTATPFSLVENEHLRAAFRLSNRNVALPTASRLGRSLLDDAYGAARARVDSVLSAFEYNSIAVNGWSSDSSGGGGYGGEASGTARAGGVAPSSTPSATSASTTSPVVNYMIVNEQHAFLLESSGAPVDLVQPRAPKRHMKSLQSTEKQDAEALVSKLVRIMDRCGHPISGASFESCLSA